MKKQSHSHPAPKRIAYLQDPTLHGARTFIENVAKWAHAHADWRILLQEGRPNEQALDPVALHADAAYLSGQHLDVIPTLRTHHIPFVVGDPLPKNWERLPTLRGVPVIKLDSRAVGVLAADYLLERRYTSFAYVSETEDLSWSCERRDGFIDRLAQAGFNCTVYGGLSRRERRQWIAERPRMMKWLADLPKPTAIFAAMDGRARLVLDACAEAGIVVPNEIAVLGVDDDPMICETAYPRLSSIRVGGCGNLAAEVLDNLLNGRPIPHLRQTIPPYDVVTRESTGHHAMSNPLLARAFIFIRDHAGTEPLDVPAVVARMGCSRRQAEKLFAEQVGRTIKDEITRVKFEEVKRLLAETNLTIAEITERCAFSCEAHLSRRFAALFGQSMTEWRRQKTGRTNPSR